MSHGSKWRCRHGPFSAAAPSARSGVSEGSSAVGQGCPSFSVSPSRLRATLRKNCNNAPSSSNYSPQSAETSQQCPKRAQEALDVTAPQQGPERTVKTPSRGKRQRFRCCYEGMLAHSPTKTRRGPGDEFAGPKGHRRAKISGNRLTIFLVRARETGAGSSHGLELQPMRLVIQAANSRGGEEGAADCTSAMRECTTRMIAVT